jgi:endonuclease/exonuclease/phosphatase family metal-dependent hydrolase
MTGNEPVILTGDFNYDQRAEGYKIISQSGLLKDTYEIAELRYALNGTFNNFNPQQKTDSRIDHVFVSNEFRVIRYGLLTDIYWTEREQGGYIVRIPSDHYPVKVEVSFNK